MKSLIIWLIFIILAIWNIPIIVISLFVSLWYWNIKYFKETIDTVFDYIDELLPY